MRKVFSELNFLIEKRKAEEKYFKNYLRYGKLIKREVKKILGEVRVFVFGSVLRKDEIPRDIDVLIISPKLKTSAEKSKARAQFWQRLGFSSPFEIHLITPKEYQDWYSHQGVCGTSNYKVITSFSL